MAFGSILGRLPIWYRPIVAELSANSQPLDATLTALAAYNTNGLIAQTAADTFAGRLITTTYNELSISNADGVSGDPLINLGSDMRGGWQDGSLDSWAYASATSMTVASDATTRHAVGDRIKLVQSGATKYFYVTGVAATTLTLNGGTDYSLTNVSISGGRYSHQASPYGFPSFFAYAPALTYSGGMGGPASGSGFFSMMGHTVYNTVQVTGGTLITAAGTDVYCTHPVTAAATHYIGGGLWWTDNAGAGVGHCFANSTTTLGVRKTTPVAWALGAGFGFSVNYFYRAA